MSVARLEPRAYHLGLVGVFAGTGLLAAFLGLRLVGRWTVARGLALLILGGLVAVAVARLPEAGPGAGRLRQQAAIGEYLLLGALYGQAFRRRYRDASLLTTGVAAAVIVGIADQAVQWWLPGQIGRLQDLRYSLVGGGLGVGWVAVMARLGRGGFAMTRTGWVATLRAIAFLSLAAAAFVHGVSLGHALEVPEVGAGFRSWFPRQRLEVLSRTWRPRDPGMSLGALLRQGEDRYLGEARWHAQRREQYLAADECVPGYQEEYVLERFYRACVERGSVPSLALGERERLEAAAVWARRAPRDLGPRAVVVAVDGLTLWLLVTAWASGLALAAEGLLLGRSTG